MLVFSVADKGSIEELDRWKTSIEKFARDDVFVVLVGNKCDLEREVSVEEGKEIAIRLDIDYLETSAKENDGIERN